MTDLLQSIDARGVATLTLNRPERHNAFDDLLVAEATTALRVLEATEAVRIVVIRGAGSSFCAGGDIDWLERMSRAPFEENFADANALAELMLCLDRLSKPTVAFVHGAAYGGGVGLAVCCDIAVATERASFCLSEARLGLIPAAIGPFVIRAIGARQARRLMLTGEPVSAARARDLGFVHEVAREEEAPAQFESIVEALLRCAPGAQAEAKAFAAFCTGRTIDDQMAWDSARLLAELRDSAEGREGLRAFIEKRAPDWRRARSGGDVSQTPDR